MKITKRSNGQGRVEENYSFKFDDSRLVTEEEPEPPKIDEDSGNDEEDLYLDINYNKWTQNGQSFIPTGNITTVKTVPCGLYKLEYTNNLGYYMIKENYYNDEVLHLPLPQIVEILKDISSFWDRKKLFTEYGYTHKRGILMHGKAGCGKSFAIQLIIKDLIENQNGIVIKIGDGDDLNYFKTFFNHRLRIIEPNRKVVVIIEDIEGLVNNNNSTETLLLNLLDGINQSENIIYLATTNYPDMLKERITNRPSRFDRRYDFNFPNDEVRKYYFEHKLKPKDIKKYGGIKKWVDKTEKLTLAHLRELIISTVILGNDFDVVLKNLFDMGKTLEASDKIKHGKIGFH